MPNDFYNATGNPADNSQVVSSDMRSEFAAIVAGFNKLPALTGNGNKLVVINSSGTGMDVTSAPAGLTSVNKIALTQPASGATLTILDGKTLTVNHSLTLAGTDGTTMTFPATSASVARIDAAQTFVGAQTFSGLIDANLGLAVTGANFTSRGISDTATAVALTLSGSGANSVTIANSATNPTIGTSGGGVSFNPAGQGEAFRVTTGGASTINYFSLSGAVTGSRLTLLATGADANVGASWQTKGSGSHLFVTETGASAQVEIRHTASADRYITLTGSNGGNPTIGTSAGGLTITPSTGVVSINSPTNCLVSAIGESGYGGFYASGSTGNPAHYFFAVNSTEVARITADASALNIRTGSTPATQVSITHTASANQYITLTGGVSNGVQIGAAGTTDANIYMVSAGGGFIDFCTGNANNNQARIGHTASAENFLTITGAIASGSPTLYSGGSDTDVNLSLATKGTGAVRFITNYTVAGAEQVRVTHTASADRYITLTGSNGGNPTISVSTGALLLSGVIYTDSVLNAHYNVATPAGGATLKGILMGTAQIGTYFGSGAPTVSAAKGSIYLRSDGSATNNRMYVNTDGSTTWTAVTTAA